MQHIKPTKDICVVMRRLSKDYSISCLFIVTYCNIFTCVFIVLYCICISVAQAFQVLLQRQRHPGDVRDAVR